MGLTPAPAQAIASERARVAREGWMISMDALALLRELGVDPASDGARIAIARVRRNLRWESLGNRPYFDGETEPCINGAILAFGSYFGERSDAIVDRQKAHEYLLERRLLRRLSSGEIISARCRNGRWPMNQLHDNRLGFPVEPETRRASRWNTLRAMRVLKWYDGR